MIVLGALSPTIRQRNGRAMLRDSLGADPEHSLDQRRFAVLEASWRGTEGRESAAARQRTRRQESCPVGNKCAQAQPYLLVGARNRPRSRGCEPREPTGTLVANTSCEGCGPKFLMMATGSNRAIDRALVLSLCSA
jgi:hypothetical protein